VPAVVARVRPRHPVAGLDPACQRRAACRAPLHRRDHQHQAGRQQRRPDHAPISEQRGITVLSFLVENQARFARRQLATYCNIKVRLERRAVVPAQLVSLVHEQRAQVMERSPPARDGLPGALDPVRRLHARQCASAGPAFPCAASTPRTGNARLPDHRAGRGGDVIEMPATYVVTEPLRAIRAASTPRHASTSRQSQALEIRWCRALRVRAGQDRRARSCWQHREVRAGPAGTLLIDLVQTRPAGALLARSAFDQQPVPLSGVASWSIRSPNSASKRTQGRRAANRGAQR